ncbi:MAG: adenylate kinase [Clostridia bacterium]|nr:adenylate kinase [Clostridia bacterium]
MILLIAGGSHTGKTALAQKLLEKRHIPYLSVDHLKMGLIRSGHTVLTPCSPEGELTAYLWPIVREMIKTAIENKQHLTVEGCYIPFGWERDFEPEYLCEIRYICLVMTENYIRNHFDDVRKYAGLMEDRGADEDFSMEEMLRNNLENRRLCEKYGYRMLLIDSEYRADPEWI